MRRASSCACRREHFLAAERDRRLLAGILVALAALTRLQGAVLALPIWLLLFLRDGRHLRRSQAWLLLGPLAAIAFLGAVSVLAGGAGAYGAAQAAWGRAGVGGAAPDASLGSLLSLVNVIQLATLLVAVSCSSISVRTGYRYPTDS